MNPSNPSSGSAAEAAVLETGAVDAEALAEAVASARACIEQGDVEGGLAAFRAIAAQYPQVPEVANNLGAICAAMGRAEEAAEAFGRAAELTPTAANPWYNRGLMRFQCGQFLAALEDFQRAAARCPDDPEFHNNIGVTLFQLGRLEEARSAFDRALALRPDYVAAALNRVDVELAAGREIEAYESLRALTTRTDSAEAQDRLVEVSLHLAVQALENARQDCIDVLEHQGSNAAGAERLQRIRRALACLAASEHAAEPPTAAASA